MPFDVDVGAAKRRWQFYLLGLHGAAQVQFLDKEQPLFHHEPLLEHRNDRDVTFDPDLWCSRHLDVFKKTSYLDVLTANLVSNNDVPLVFRGAHIYTFGRDRVLEYARFLFHNWYVQFVRHGWPCYKTTKHLQRGCRSRSDMRSQQPWYKKTTLSVTRGGGTPTG
ncbi:hypothetical protein NOVOSPHI9U_160008 [Novosphingobium sp. 9U]|nr:hypothetical protein NOVOSPHI9U_160008 [Novosphingobium sp. 9U]